MSNDQQPRQRRVRFHGRVQFKTIRHIKDFTDHEIRSSYYRKKDYARMSDEVGQITELVASDERAIDSICTRGLEHLIDENIADYRAEKMIQSVDAVLDEQDDQQDEDIYDPDIIAQIYAEIAAPLLEEAHMIGLKDAEDAQLAAAEIDQAAAAGTTTMDTEDIMDQAPSQTEDDTDEYIDEEEEEEVSSEQDDVDIVSDAEVSNQSNEHLQTQQQQPPQPPVVEQDEVDDQPIEVPPPQPPMADDYDVAISEPSEVDLEETPMQPEPVPSTQQAKQQPPAKPSNKKSKSSSSSSVTSSKSKKKDKASKKKKESKKTKTKKDKPSKKDKPQPPPAPKDDDDDDEMKHQHQSTKKEEFVSESEEPLVEDDVDEDNFAETPEDFMDLELESDEEIEDGVLTKELDKIRTPNKSDAYRSAQERVKAKRKSGDGAAKRKRQRKQRTGVSEFSPLVRRQDGSFTFRNRELELAKEEQKRERQEKVKSSLFAFLDDDDYALPPSSGKKKPARGKLVKKKGLTKGGGSGRSKQ